VVLAGGMYGQHHHVRLDLHSDFDRLARLITGHAVGVVMAGGGARSFGHVGAVKALRESGVPIDLTGGTSMGAIVAAAVASRWTDEELVERFRRSFVDNNPLSDYTLPFVSLFGGHQVGRLLRLAFGDKDIEDLVLPFFCMTANLTTSSADMHQVGKLWRWLRASVSLPGVMPPFNDAGQVHVDGGVIDNFPVREMRRLGRGATQGNAAHPVDRAHPAALGAGRQRRPHDGGPPGRRPPDHAAIAAVRPARLDELRCRDRDRLPHHDGSTRQGAHPADRSAHLYHLAL